jgi:hypothetical protein
MDSILTSIKKMIGIDKDFTEFDDELILFINGIFTILTQLGIGKSDFTITGTTEVWSDFLTDSKNLELVKTYIYLRTKVVFDPPASSFVLDSINKQISEYEWRLYENAEEPNIQKELAAIAASQLLSDDEV